MYGPPRFDTVVEPFAGSASYCVRWDVRRAILYDLNPVVIAIWQYLIAVSEQEILSLPDIADGQTVDDLRVPQEARWLIGFCVNAAVSAPRKRPSKWMLRKKSKDANYWGAKRRARIASQLAKIRGWSAHLGSYRDVDTSRDATWFIDPPYEVKGDHYPYGASGINYADLGAWCRGLNGHVVVCENSGAAWLPFRPLVRSRSQIKGRQSAEAVWP